MKLTGVRSMMFLVSLTISACSPAKSAQNENFEVDQENELGQPAAPTNEQDLRTMGTDLLSEQEITSDTREKRSLWNFKGMIRCATGRSAFKYNKYGCWCGLGGSGRPVDRIDRCCRQHDFCYTRAAKNGCKKAHFFVYGYSWKCHKSRRHGYPVCGRTNTGCRKRVCDCDRKFALCIKYIPYHGKKKCPSKKG